jgi:CRP-like cAMP-binding protein
MLDTGTQLDHSYARPALPPLPVPARATTSLDDFMTRGTLRGIEAKKHMFTEGDQRAFVYKILSGAICLYKLLPDGRRQVIGFAYAGDMIGLSMTGQETLNAQAMVATRVKCLPVASLLQMADRDTSLAHTLYEALANELSSVREHLVCVGQRTAMERLATFLLSLSKRNECRGTDPETIDLPMTRTDIGDFLGLTIETVSRTFTKLRAIGIIEIDQGTTIRIIDSEQLKVLADGQGGI